LPAYRPHAGLIRPNVRLGGVEAACRPREIPEYFGDGIAGAVVGVGPEVAVGVE